MRTAVRGHGHGHGHGHAIKPVDGPDGGTALGAGLRAVGMTEPG
ncbi:MULTISPECIES: hypothetical protein [Streptomyces]|nr:MULTISPECIES: hypothetical protein [Streptomyces]